MLTTRPNSLIQIALIATVTGILPAQADWRSSHGEELGGGAAVQAPSERKYAPSREIDILHLALDVRPDFKQRSVSGKATLRFKPIAKPFRELQLDGIELDVTAVESTEPVMGWQSTGANVIVTFSRPIPPDREAQVTITYRAVPTGGLYFRTAEMGYAASDTQLWTQGEAIEARRWYPCYDSPNEKFTSEVTCHAPIGMTVLSNGKLVSAITNAQAGLVAVRWLQDKPHVNYLVSLVAGYFKGIEDSYRGLPLAFYTPASKIQYAATSFEGTKDMLAFYEKEIGVPYPWAKYFQVAVLDFNWGGMENTSITTLTDRTLHPPEFEELRESTGLVAHELVHQWFGDLVTCKDWANVWLNEGFATYYEELYQGHKHGPDALLYGLHMSARHIIEQPDQTNAIVRRNYTEPDDLFGYLAYPKGAWIVHMLRSQLGQELYRKCIQSYLQRHQFGNVTTEDLRAVVEDMSGRSYDRFFDQWVYHASQPDLGVSYSWDEQHRLAKISIDQKQKLGPEVLLFEFPLPIRFKFKSGAITNCLAAVRERSEDFYFALPESPAGIRVDPELTVLGKIQFTPPPSALDGQLTDPDDMLGRLLSVEQLSGRRDALEKLKKRLNTDPFWGVRLAASQSIRAIRTDEAFAALAASTAQPDSRVRRQVVSDMNTFYSDAARLAAMRVAKADKNPDIRAAAVTALGAYINPEVSRVLLELVGVKSFQNVLADAAIQAMRGHQDPAFIGPIMDALRERADDFTSAGFGRGLEALAWLARDEDNHGPVREFILPFVESKKQAVKLAAISALGTLGDQKSIPVLEKLMGAAKQSPEQRAAERALASLNDGQKPGAQLGSLRSEVLNLLKENRDLRKEVDELKKKFEALGSKGQAASTGGKSVKPVKPPKAE